MKFDNKHMRTEAKLTDVSCIRFDNILDFIVVLI